MDSIFRNRKNEAGDPHRPITAMDFRAIPRHFFRVAAALLSALALAMLAAESASGRYPRSAPGFAALDTIRRGVNILGYDGLWKGEVDAPFRFGDFRLIHQAGFDHVRINFFGFHYMDERNEIDKDVLARLDRVIDEALKNGLTPILDEHDNALCQSRPDQCSPKLVSFWRQIAQHYAGKSPRLIFEILNEPGGAMSPAQWNDNLAAALAAIRAHDPSRAVIVGALNVGDPHSIEKLALPAADDKLIATVHYYAPMRFTHQGAPWSSTFRELHDVTWGTPAERARVVEDLAVAATWGRAHNRPIYLGEFGTYDKAPADSRAAWTRHVARTAESFGWGWAYWQFDHDFALFDSSTHRWNRTLLDALTK